MDHSTWSIPNDYASSKNQNLRIGVIAEEYWAPSHFDTPSDLPLVWTVEDDILYLDNVWICPVKYIRQNSLDEAPMWVNQVAMEIDLYGGTLDIIITKWMGKYSIAGVERTVV